VHSVIPVEQPETAYLRVLARTLNGVFLATQELDGIFRRSEEINEDAFTFLDAVKRPIISFSCFSTIDGCPCPICAAATLRPQIPGEDPALTGGDIKSLMPKNSRRRNVRLWFPNTTGESLTKINKSACWIRSRS
jgi:hypothetical protein